MAGLIYNVTVKISPEVHVEWLVWMKTVHIPEVMATACFKSYRLLRLEGYDDDDGLNYAIQYICPNQGLFDIYQRDHAPALQKKHREKYEGQFVAFRTILHILDEG